MTLEHFLLKNPCVTVVSNLPGGPVYIANDVIRNSAARVELFNLSDWAVSSQSGGCYILVKRSLHRG